MGKKCASSFLARIAMFKNFFIFFLINKAISFFIHLKEESIKPTSANNIRKKKLALISTLDNDSSLNACEP